MTITSAIVLFSVIWFMVFFVVLPIRLRTQGDAGAVVPGTHSSAPHEPRLWLKAGITTGVAALLWLVIAGVILSGRVTVDDFDWMGLGRDSRAEEP